jgi:NDP-sugar pyrophosphorylase family protein
MEDRKTVIITTSGLGSRLGELTEFTNKSLIRVGDKPAISHIIETYPKDTRFIITLGHYGDHVKQYIEMVYSHLDIKFVWVDIFRGDGSSLGYSLLKCRSSINGPFVFHASDTLVSYPSIKKIISVEGNAIMGARKKDSSQYRTINCREGKMERINEKGELFFDCCYIGICKIECWEDFFISLEHEVGNGSHEISDAHIINSLKDNQEFTLCEIDESDWSDVGNTSELKRSRERYQSSANILDKKDESIFFIENSVVKFFNDTKTNINRVRRGNMLYPLTPEIESNSDNFYRYKKADGHLFSKSVDPDKFLKFLEWSFLNLWKNKEREDIRDLCYDFYIEKTKKRILKYLNGLPDLPEMINGTKVPPVIDIIDSLDKEWICSGLPVQFHGDFILDNIIELEGGGFKLLDWRQDFAGILECGDIYYDLAKLNHNLTVNHDIVNKDLFSADRDNCYLLVNSKLLDCKKVLENFVKNKGLDWEKIEVLTSIIWINMSPLHEYPLNNFLFTFGKYNLYKRIKNEH